MACLIVFLHCSAHRNPIPARLQFVNTRWPRTIPPAHRAKALRHALR
jgi:hypothetical protein